MPQVLNHPGGSALAVRQPNRKNRARALSADALSDPSAQRDYVSANPAGHDADRTPLFVVPERTIARWASSDESLGLHVQVQYRLAQGAQRWRFGWPRCGFLFPQCDRADS